MSKLTQFMMGSLMEEAGGGDGGGGGGTTSTLNQAPSNTGGSLPEGHWANSSTISDEFKSVAFVKDAPDLQTFVKNAVETKRMVGNAVRLPGENATPQEIATFYEKLGRPSAHTEYTPPADVKLSDGISIPDPLLDGAKKTFYDAGLSKSQAEKVLGWYYGHLNSAQTEQATQTQTRISEGMNSLKQEWGDQTPQKIDTAKAVVKKFATPEFNTWLDSSGMGSDPQFIKMLANVGGAILEDRATAGGGMREFMTDSASALAQINDLKADPTFTSRLMSSTALGHKEALAQWNALHKAAYGEEPVR